MLSSWVANPAIFVLKVFSCSFAAGVESWSASDDAISSPAEVMVLAKTVLISAATSSVPSLSRFGASAFFFSLR